MTGVSDQHSIHDYYDADPLVEWERTQSGPYHQIEFELVERCLADALPPASSVLDLGSGPGRHSLRLAARGHRVGLVDISQRCLALARSEFAAQGLDHRMLFTLCSAAEDLPDPEMTFDAVLLFGPLYHILDEDRAEECLRRAIRCLRPGGFLFAIFVTRTSVIRDLLKRGRLTEINQLLDDGYLDHGRYRPLSAASRADYMPPTRTHWACEARRLLERHRLGKISLRSCEGVAAFMRPYVDKGFSVSDVDQLVTTIARTCELPSVIDSGDHFLASGRKGR